MKISKSNQIKMNAEQSIHKLAVEISLAHVKEKENDVKFYNLPINKICQVPVIVRLIKMANTKDKVIVMFEISSEYAYTFINNEHEYATLYEMKFQKCESVSLIEFYQQIVTKIKEIIKNLKFDKLNGKLVENQVMEEEVMMNIFGDCANVEFDWDRCACCLENTKTKTPCGHSVCVLCWTTLKKECDEDEEEMKFQKCPICRNEMYY